MNSLIKITTEIAYELPLFKTIELLTTPFDLHRDQIVFSDHNISMERQKVSKSATSGKLLDFGTVEQQKSVNSNIFVYVFHHSNAMDMKGNINYFGGRFMTKSVLVMNDVEIYLIQEPNTAQTCRFCLVQVC
jgi:hypothetical protein